MRIAIKARLCLLLGVLVIAGCGGPATGSADEGGVTTVRFGSVGGLTDAGLYLADEFGYFSDAGLSVEFSRMDSGPALSNAIATGQLDVAGISVTPGLYSAFSQSIDMKLVGDKQSLRTGFSATRMVARKDFLGADTAATLANLRGKTIAVSAKASAAYMLLRDLLVKHGLGLDDVRVTELSYGNMASALSSKAVDAAIMLEPFLAQALAAGDVGLVSDLLEVLPPEGVTLVPLVYGADFLGNREAAESFMEAYMKGVRKYNDAFSKDVDRQRVIDIIAERAKIDPAIVAQASPGGLDPDQEVGTEYLSLLQDFFADQGLLREKIEVSEMIDPSFAEAAVKKLGEY
jgi:NitT/TauT family transport system substrate-binding protein